MGLGGNNRSSEVLNADYISGQISVTTTQVEVKVGASRLAGRQSIFIFNNSSDTVYFGPNGVTTSGATKGLPIEPDETGEFNFGDKVAVYLISTNALGSSIIVQEAS